MNPETATKLAQMGDVKANAAKLRVALEEAKKNPNDPRSAELRRRLERGMFNVELQALGKKPFPVQVPKIDMAKAMGGMTAGPQSKVTDAPEQGNVGPFDVGAGIASLKERGGDIKETFLGVGKRLGEGFQKAGEIARDSELSIPQRVVGPVIASASGAASAFGEVGIGVGKLALTQEAENTVKDFAQSVGEQISETEAAKKTIDWYEALPPEQKANLQMFGGIANVVSTVLGLRGSSAVTGATVRGAEAAVPVIREGVEATVDAAKTGARTTVGMTQRALTPSPEVVNTRLNEAVSRIVQPTGKTPNEIAKEVQQARRALSELDTKDVSDYASLNAALDGRVTAIAKAQDEYLAQFPEKFKADQLGRYTKVGKETVTTTPVQDALDGLERAFKLSGDAVGEAKIRQLRQKMDSEGLNVTEINQLARDYNKEFRNLAFDKMGNPKAGFNAENYEAVRKGVKEVARDRMPDDKSKELDARLTDNYETQRMVDKMQVAIEKAIAKAPKEKGFIRRTVGTVVGAGVNLADTLTGNIVSNIGRTIASRAGVAQKTSLTPLEIQMELSKNLKTIEKLNQIQDPDAFAKAFEKYLSEQAITPSQ